MRNSFCIGLISLTFIFVSCDSNRVFDEYKSLPNQWNKDNLITFTFKAPVYLEGGKEYCICLASNSTKYSVYIYINGIFRTQIYDYFLVENRPVFVSPF